MTELGQYPYAEGDLLENPNTYFYSAYQGESFLEDWMALRRHCREEMLVSGSIHKDTDLEPPCETRDLLFGFRRRLGDGSFSPSDRHQLSGILRNFEAKKRLFRSYGENFSSKGQQDFRDIELYVIFSEVLCSAYTSFGCLQYLNAMIKCMDILCSAKSDLNSDQRYRVAGLIGKEIEAVGALSYRVLGCR